MSDQQSTEPQNADIENDDTKDVYANAKNTDESKCGDRLLKLKLKYFGGCLLAITIFMGISYKLGKYISQSGAK
ncbi:MAG: hypothetical protein Faunusvirus44_7 [Faunusvirus sp.]|jgi:hypothetical protein|uniref:Uncharacterized protein n=1 Tax=Faunusvirus sp. TaxID=2487766 RepID=A0A3G4ZXU3_9VIRU|nr:MAG: hypothetical protein Faunusvirus44_7 [Faunusvirus sp.]